MTEKRFKFYRNEEFDTPVIYDKEDEVYYFCVDLEKIGDALNAQHDENERLKQKNKGLQSELHIFKEDVTHSNKIIDKLNDENEQLQQRNNRQAKQLDRLYRLIEEKDWRTLSDILDDFKRCEEQLQRESGTYGDFE